MFLEVAYGKNLFLYRSAIGKKNAFFLSLYNTFKKEYQVVVGVLCDSNVKWCGYQGKGNPTKTFGVPLRGYPWVQIRKPDIGSY